MDVFFLAAGLGTRFKPVTDHWPKPCIPFLNVPMGLYHFRFLKNLQFNELVVNTHHHAEKIESLYKKQPYYKKTIRFSHEPKILDTAGGLKNAFNHKSEHSSILMMNADEIIFPKDEDFLSKAVDNHEKEKALATLVVMQHSEAGKKFGAIWCDDLQVKNIGKTNQDLKLRPWHYVGIILINSKLLNYIEINKPLNIFYDILINHLNAEKVQIYPIEAEWYETGNPQDFLHATEQKLTNLSKNPGLTEFINEYDKSIMHQHSLVSNNISFKDLKLDGFNVIAKDSILTKNHYENSVIFADQVIAR